MVPTAHRASSTPGRFPVPGGATASPPCSTPPPRGPPDRTGLWQPAAMRPRLVSRRLAHLRAPVVDSRRTGFGPSLPSGSNSAGRVSASQARPWAHLSPSPAPPPSAHRSAGPAQFSAPGYIKRWAIVGQIHDLPIRLVPRRGWCSCWPHGRPVGPAARPDRRFATGHCRPTSTRTLSSARTDVGWSVTTTWARG